MAVRHLRLPLGLSTSGSLVTLEQDTPAEVAQSIAILLTTRPGEREAVPDYGSPDPTFTAQPTVGMADAVATWEQRAVASEFLAGVPGQVREVLARIGVAT